MKKEIQTLVAMQLLSLRDSITTHGYNKNEIKEDNFLTIFGALKEAISEGLDIMLPLDEEQVNGNSSYCIGYNGKITFIEKMLSNHDSDPKIINFLYEKLSEEDLKKAHPKFAQNIYSVLHDNGISMKKMFEIGFDFQQGKFDEDSKASSGDLDFFECCLCYKPDFDFSYEYMDYTLKNAVEESIEYYKKENKNVDIYVNLMNFIDKAILKQNLENKPVNPNAIKENKLKI